MFTILWLTVLSFIVAVNGDCPHVPPKLRTPDLERIGGIWFKVATSSPYAETRYQCNLAHNTWNPANTTLEISTKNYNVYNGSEVQDWYGNVWRNADGTYENTLQNSDGRTVPYFEYYSDNYATFQIDYGCPIKNGVASPTPIVWIQSRYCKYNQTIFDIAVKKLAEGGITNLTWTKFGAAECCAQGSLSSSFSSSM